jgi:transposase
VAETGARLGVSTHSLYELAKAVTLDKDEKRAAELIDAKSEILRFRTQMRRLEEERNLLKKPRSTLPESPSVVPLDERTPSSLFTGRDAPDSASGTCRILSMAA